MKCALRNADWLFAAEWIIFLQTDAEALMKL
jgi:hypothetical protein